MKFSRKDKNAFNKSLNGLLKNSFKNINKVDNKGKTILHRAVRISNQETVKLLIEKGAEINATDDQGFTPLHSAALAKRLGNVKELIRSGADMDAAEGISKDSPLHFACMVGAERVIKELIKVGAKINQENKFGQTPMYCLLDKEKNKRARKFMKEQGGIIRDKPKICDEVEESVGEMVEIWERKYLPKLKGKMMDLGEIRKRDRQEIAKDFRDVVIKLADQMNEMIRTLD